MVPIQRRNEWKAMNKKEWKNQNWKKNTPMNKSHDGIGLLSKLPSI